MTRSLLSERGWDASTHIPWGLYTMRCTVSGAETRKGSSTLWFSESQWPAPYAESQAGFVLSVQRQQLLLLRSPLWEGMTGGTCFPFSFSWAFSLPRAAVGVFCVRGGGNDTFHLVPPLPALGVQGASGLALCVQERRWKVGFLGKAKLLIIFFLFSVWGLCGEERFCNLVFLNKLLHFAEGSWVQLCMLRAVPFFFLMKMPKSNVCILASCFLAFVVWRFLGSDDFNDKNCR